MSRTHHHSRRWGRTHRWTRHSGRSWGMTHSRIGEAPGWHVRLYDERPSRRADAVLLGRIAGDLALADAAWFRRMGNRKPHTYYW